MWRSTAAISRSRSPDWNAASSSPCSKAMRARSASRPKRKKYARIRGAMLRHTWVVWGCPERESTSSWKRMSASTQRSRSPARAPSPISHTSFASSAKSASVMSS